jgi:hypothetical protein
VGRRVWWVLGGGGSINPQYQRGQGTSSGGFFMEPWPLTTGWHGLNLGFGQGCLFCKMKETVIHVFSVYTRLMPLMSLLECLCERLGVVFTVEMFIMRYRYSCQAKVKCVLLNFLFAQAKLAIWQTRRNRVKGGGITDSLLLFKGMVSARLRVEFEFYKMI